MKSRWPDEILDAYCKDCIVISFFCLNLCTNMAVHRLKADEIPLQEESENPEKKVTYLMPAMDFHSRRHDIVMGEAANMNLVLDGKKVLSIIETSSRQIKMHLTKLRMFLKVITEMHFPNRSQMPYPLHSLQENNTML